MPNWTMRDSCSCTTSVAFGIGSSRNYSMPFRPLLWRSTPPCSCVGALANFLHQSYELKPLSQDTRDKLWNGFGCRQIFLGVCRGISRNPVKLPELDLAGAKSDFWCLFLEGLKTLDFQNLRPHVKLSRDPGKSRNNFEGCGIGAWYAWL